MNHDSIGNIAKPAEPKSAMESAFNDLLVEMNALNRDIATLENKLLPVLHPTGEGSQKSGSPDPIPLSAPFLALIRNAHSQALAMQDRITKLRDNLVV